MLALKERLHTKKIVQTKQIITKLQTVGGLNTTNSWGIEYYEQLGDLILRTVGGLNTTNVGDWILRTVGGLSTSNVGGLNTTNSWGIEYYEQLVDWILRTDKRSKHANMYTQESNQNLRPASSQICSCYKHYTRHRFHILRRIDDRICVCSQLLYKKEQIGSKSTMWWNDNCRNKQDED